MNLKETKIFVSDAENSTFSDDVNAYLDKVLSDDKDSYYVREDKDGKVLVEIVGSYPKKYLDTVRKIARKHGYSVGDKWKYHNADYIEFVKTV